MSDQATTGLTLGAKEKALIDALEKLNVVELNNVVKYMEKVYGISTAAPVAVAASPAGAPGGAAAPAPVKKTVNVELSDAGAQKIAVIKVVREITGLGLTDAKALVDSAPKMLKENVKREEAEEMVKKLEAAGAKATLK